MIRRPRGFSSGPSDIFKKGAREFPLQRPPVTAPVRRISWIVAPPEVCCLCKEPLGAAAETSSWNGAPAHRECVRVHLIQRDPAFREPEAHEPSEESGDAPDGPLPRDEDEPDSG